ncbi:MAG: dTDP-4-amino-4,6-dideoxyglucose formyltransferase [Burkholderiaceae bacterium]
MKKILVVSDNPRITKFFQEECASQGIDDISSIQYRYSLNNKAPSEMISLGAEPIDLRNLETVAFIKSKYFLIFSLHCKQIFPADLVSAVTCINVHPGLNPHNRGWYPQVFSIINEKPIGATIHLMDSEVDHGNIIDQISVDVRQSDTSLDVYERVLKAEMMLLRKNIINIINNEFESYPPAFEGNYNSIKDFKSLCHLNLDAIAPLGEHIRLLRALSHGTFKNAYFHNKDGKKIFVRLSLEEDD